MGSVVAGDGPAAGALELGEDVRLAMSKSSGPVDDGQVPVMMYLHPSYRLGSAGWWLDTSCYPSAEGLAMATLVCAECLRGVRKRLVRLATAPVEMCCDRVERRRRNEPVGDSRQRKIWVG